MNSTTRRSIIAAAFAAIITFTLLFGAHEASAQCPGIKLRNQSNCNLLLCFYNAANQIHCQVVNANSSTPATWPAAFMPIGVRSNGGFFYPWGAGCTACISVQIPGAIATCCVIICPNPAQCAVDIFGCASPCNP
jgi:hypothetical protein